MAIVVPVAVLELVVLDGAFVALVTESFGWKGDVVTSSCEVVVVAGYVMPQDETVASSKDMSG